MCKAAAVRRHYSENRLARAGAAAMAAERSVFITSVLDNLIQSTPSVTRDVQFVTQLERLFLPAVVAAFVTGRRSRCSPRTFRTFDPYCWPE